MMKKGQHTQECLWHNIGVRFTLALVFTGTVSLFAADLDQADMAMGLDADVSVSGHVLSPVNLTLRLLDAPSPLAGEGA